MLTTWSELPALKLFAVAAWDPNDQSKCPAHYLAWSLLFHPPRSEEPCDRYSHLSITDVMEALYRYPDSDAPIRDAWPKTTGSGLVFRGYLLTVKNNILYYYNSPYEELPVVRELPMDPKGYNWDICRLVMEFHMYNKGDWIPWGGNKGDTI